MPEKERGWYLWTLIVNYGEDGDFEIVKSFPEYPSILELRRALIVSKEFSENISDEFVEGLHENKVEYSYSQVWSLTEHKVPRPFAALAKDGDTVKLFYKNPSRDDVSREIIRNSELESSPWFHEVYACTEDLFRHGSGETFSRMTQEGTVPLNTWYLIWL